MTSNLTRSLFQFLNCKIRVDNPFRVVMRMEKGPVIGSIKEVLKEY